VFHHHHASGDMTSWLTVVISALLGAIAGLMSSRLGQILDDRKRRQKVATVLYVELRSLDTQLRRMVELGSPIFFRMRPAVEMLDAFATDLVLFDVSTIASLLNARAFAKDIESTQNANRDISPENELVGVLNRGIDRKARMALEEVASAAEGLVRSGAKPGGDDRPRRWDRDASAPLPRSPFAANDV